MTNPGEQQQSDATVEGLIPERTQTQEKTIALLVAGVLAHDGSERDHAYELLQSRYRKGGGKSYAERIAQFNNPPVILAEFRELLPGASLGFESPAKQARRAQAQADQYNGNLTKIADHILGYVEDGTMNVEALRYTRPVIQHIEEPYSAGIFVVVNPDPKIYRALATIARLYETQDYATRGYRQISSINFKLEDATSDESRQRVAEIIDSLSVDDAIELFDEAILYETGRIEFWKTQLQGRPALPARYGVAGTLPAVPERQGIAEISPELKSKIDTRLAGIAITTDSKWGSEHQTESA